jgi:ATP-dependent DNA helicase RecG
MMKTTLIEKGYRIQPAYHPTIAHYVIQECHALIRDFLREVGSNLYEDATALDFTQLCRQMHIVSGPGELLKPLNVGLLFFNDAPDRFFPQVQIDVVQFPDGPGGDVFTEKIF